MKNLLDDIVEFHTKFGLEGPSALTMPDTNVTTFRINFLLEEQEEICSAVIREDFPTIADGFVDLVYVGVGTLHLCGWTGSVPVFPTRYFPNYKHGFDLANTMLGHLMGEVESAADTRNGQTFALAVNQLSQCAVALAELNGIPFLDCWNEGHRKNMMKERAKRAEDSTRKSTLDVIKPPGWTPPDLGAILRLQGWAG